MSACPHCGSTTLHITREDPLSFKVEDGEVVEVFESDWRHCGYCDECGESFGVFEHRGDPGEPFTGGDNLAIDEMNADASIENLRQI